MKRFVFAAAVFLAGCLSSPKYVEGTSLQLGAYVPFQSNLYGVEICSYVNGCVVRTSTNMNYEIGRRHAVTNSWCWGMLESVEYSDTKVKFSK